MDELKDPKGGLSDKGRKFYGVKAGVKNYEKANKSDKKRWISWASRFYGRKNMPPLKKNGEPTRFALTANAWGEKTPSTVEEARSIYKKALKRKREMSSVVTVRKHRRIIKGIGCSTVRRHSRKRASSNNKFSLEQGIEKAGMERVFKIINKNRFKDGNGNFMTKLSNVDNEFAQKAIAKGLINMTYLGEANSLHFYSIDTPVSSKMKVGMPKKIKKSTPKKYKSVENFKGLRDV